MTLIFIGVLALVALLTAGLLFTARMRLLQGEAQYQLRLPEATRYQPMLRLLSDADLDFAGNNPKLRAKLRANRRQILRGYLRCLTKDYARLLSAIRRVMVESGVDRPDLASTLATNRIRFAIALCRIEFHLQLHALGVGKVDISGLVEALDSLRGAVNVMTPATGSAW